jgi:hypothetical protein
MATNRTLQFLGYTIGTSPVQITASINDTVVFSGAVETKDLSLIDNLNPLAFPVLFSVDNSDLFPTTFSGSYPMTMTVTGGDAVVGDVLSNYMQNFAIDTQCELSNASINGTTLTFESATGNISTKMALFGKGITPNTHITGGSGTTWTVDNNQTVGPITILEGKWTETAGNASDFLLCYLGGNPPNSESNFDVRTDVKIDGSAITRSRTPESMGTWILKVPAGTTATFNLNVSPGNVSL